MTRILPVLGTGAHCAADPSLLTRVNGWINNLYAIPYSYCPLWYTPTEVESSSFADCKGKAVALYAHMKWYGATNVRIVIGKRRLGDSKTHAWVEWQTSNGKYLLDPTFNEMAGEASWTDPSTYVPYYAYDGVHKYRADNHPSSYPTIVAQNVVAMNYGVPYRTVYYGSPRWNTAQPVNQSTDSMRGQVHKKSEQSASLTQRTGNAKFASVRRRAIQPTTGSGEWQKRNLCGWQHLSTPNVAQAY